MRGAELSELEKQRLFCPSQNLTQCQPDPKHGIVLSDSSLRPCRADLKSNPMASVKAGDQLYLHWAGNGHTAAVGTCVKVSISKFAMDPNLNDFSPLETCLPFATNGVDTEANVTIPASLGDGEYTIFWLWDFTGFVFSSCADIRVGPSGGDLVGEVTPAEAIAYEKTGCASEGVGSDFCRQKFGLKSFCQDWARDSCGRSICHSDTTISPCLSDEATQAPMSTTVMPSSPAVSPSYETMGCTNTKWCIAKFGGLSYCRLWAKDHCGRSLCQGDTGTIFPNTCASTVTPLAPIGDASSYKRGGCAGLASSACTGLFGPTSYCKTWLKDMCGRSMCFGPLSSVQLNAAC